MKKKLSKMVYLKEIGIKKINREERKIIVNMNEYPELYEKLVELSRINVRTIEQQALFYIMQAIGETEMKKKRMEDGNDQC